MRKFIECLRGHPKHIIPASMYNIEDAWKTLDAIYGDPSRVMAAKKNKILSMKQFPKDENSGKTLKEKVEWLMKLEITLKEVVELADSDEEMEKEAYSGSMITTVRNLFSFVYLSDLSKYRGTGRQKLLKMIEYVSDLRENRHRWTW